MVYRGRFKNGVVVLDDSTGLHEGEVVDVRPTRRRSKRSGKRKSPPSLYEQLKSVVGIVTGLPTDMAAQHDHYIHGQPKR